MKMTWSARVVKRESAYFATVSATPASRRGKFLPQRFADPTEG